LPRWSHLLSAGRSGSPSMKFWCDPAFSPCEAFFQRLPSAQPPHKRPGWN
jgi:hypothetical protein